MLMLASGNLLKPSDGAPVTVPTQDMILGSYYLTTVRENEEGAGLSLIHISLPTCSMSVSIRTVSCPSPCCAVHWACPLTVSYTHLDVYKRQLLK